MQHGEKHYSLLHSVLLQLHHASYHVGQIVQIAKECKGKEWKTLSVPRGGSLQDYDRNMEKK